ncbi:MAG TPA: hypothetical protein PLN25_08220 [Deltaproteobacteria bacterium]|nr:hypothetical protein [Deltaproteobacteria bacterium]HQB38474.1 hypothetical protein [Deltaproteobacteria bacterium]
MQKRNMLYDTYGKFFLPRQKVLLINVNAGQTHDAYESISGNIISTTRDIIEVQTSCPLRFSNGTSDKQICKVATKLFDMGLQLYGTIIDSKPGNTLTIKMCSILEAFSLQQMPRIDAHVKLFCSSTQHQASVMQNGLKHILDLKDGNPAMDLNETNVNLSMGGFRISTSPDNKIAPVSFCAIDLLDNKRPVYAVAENIWSQHINDKFVCGYRFTSILKSDQKRINSIVSAQKHIVRSKRHQESPDWMLTWRMTHQHLLQQSQRHV